MAVPTTQWSETTPAGNDNISSGDDRMREMKTQVREVVAVDHEFTSTRGLLLLVGNINRLLFKNKLI